MPKLRINEKDRLILWHVLRYGLTHKEVVYRQFFDPKRHRVEAARKKLRRLTEGDYLQYLKEPWPYYRLTSSGVALMESLLGLPADTYRAASRPLKAASSLFERSVILAFCCLDNTPRTVLLRYEFDRWFSGCSQAGVKAWPFYLEKDPAGSILTLVVVDSGSSANRQVHRINKQMIRRLRVPALNELERRGRFRITFLTETQQRAEDVRHALTDSDAASVNLVAVPSVATIAPTSYLRK